MNIYIYFGLTFPAVIVRSSVFEIALDVENYRRVSKDKAPEKTKSPVANEVRISHSKINVYVEACQKLLQVDAMKSIVIVGKGSFVSKAVTVAEMVKRKMQGTMHQYTQIGSVATTEQWESTEDKELDSIEVIKKIPVIIIYLSIEEIPELEATSGYQAPTGPEFFE